MKANPSVELMRKLYGKVVDALAEFQAHGTIALERGDIQIRLFDREYLRWESNYFIDNFIKGLCRIPANDADIEKVSRELDELADQTFALPRTLMHRDFQSQNILIPAGEPRFVDFQGARLGPYTYDIASLVKDPYVMLPKGFRDELIRRHHEKLTAARHPLKTPSFDQYKADYLKASLQRNMQALGAYGFLSLKKRKLKYLAYARPCLELLSEGLQEAECSKLDSLRSLCIKAGEALSSGIEVAKASAGVV